MKCKKIKIRDMRYLFYFLIKDGLNSFYVIQNYKKKKLRKIFLSTKTFIGETKNR